MSNDGMVSSRRSGTEIHKAPKESTCHYFKAKNAFLSKLTAHDVNESPIKEEVTVDLPRELVENRLTQKTAYALSLISPESLAKSTSLPVLKSEAPSDASTTNFKAMDLALTSELSFARKKKTSMIVERMAPFVSPYPSTVLLTTNPTTNLRVRQCEEWRLESPRTTLPVLDVCPHVYLSLKRAEIFRSAVELRKFEGKTSSRMNVCLIGYRDAVGK